GPPSWRPAWSERQDWKSAPKSHPRSMQTSPTGNGSRTTPNLEKPNGRNWPHLSPRGRVHLCDFRSNHHKTTIPGANDFRIRYRPLCPRWTVSARDEAIARQLNRELDLASI